MKKMINTTRVEGWVYDHKLEKKVSGPNAKNPNTPYITGVLNVATDNELTNIVPVHFTYVTATTAKGANATFEVLSNIIDGKVKTVMGDGADQAATIRIDSNIGLNEFYSNRSGKEELVSAKRNEGGFIHVNETLNMDESKRATFECDMLITGAVRVEANEERNLPEKVTVKGAIFDFRGALLPIEFTALNEGAMNYFENLGASPKTPVLTMVRGVQVSKTVARKIEEESAFGDTYVREVPSQRKDWVITWAKGEPYEWDDASTLTVMELNEAISNREIALAAMKKRNDEYKASRGTAAPAITAPRTAGFNF